MDINHIVFILNKYFFLFSIKMDPIRNLCIVRDSFQKEKHIVSSIPVYEHVEIKSPRSYRKSMNNDDNHQKDIEKINENKLALRVADPFVQIRHSILKYRSSFILANIDTLYNFSLQEDGYIKPQVINMNYKYAVLDGDVGSVQYLQYRMPASTGFTYCSQDTREKICYPNKQFLNIAETEEGVEDYILGLEPEGVDLVVTHKLDKKILLSAVRVCKLGATFIVRVDDFRDDLLYILTLYFKKCSLIKPFLDNLNEKYAYFICEYYIGNSLDIADILDVSDKTQISESFKSYQTNYSLSLNNLKRQLEKDTMYNMHKCAAILNLE